MLELSDELYIPTVILSQYIRDVRYTINAIDIIFLSDEKITYV